MIKFTNVTQRFADGTVAFTDLSFTINDGELVLITGPSGSGKTTILNLLIKEYQPIAGEIEIDDQPLVKIKSSQLPLHRRKIGIVFQDYKLIEELNVWENIAMPLFIKGEKLSDIEERVTDLLKLVELTDKALMFPKQLSGGEAQRISIARALATGPNVIFADEPTGNLDEKTSQHIINLLKKINDLGTTLIIATHDPVIIKKLKGKKIDLTHNQVRAETEQDTETSNTKQSQSKTPAPKVSQPKTAPTKKETTDEVEAIKTTRPKPVKLQLKPKSSLSFTQKLQKKVKKISLKKPDDGQKLGAELSTKEEKKADDDHKTNNDIDHKTTDQKTKDNSNNSATISD